jgi:DNA-binding NarL/FixJ family response regulator
MPIRILVVSNSVSAGRRLGSAVDGHGNNVSLEGIVDCGPDALPLLKAKGTDVVLFDPGSNSTAIAELLPRIARSGVSVLLCTRGQSVAVQDQALRHGAIGIIPADSDGPTLQKAIEKVHKGEAWVGRTAMARLLRPATQARRRSASAAGADALTAREREIVVAVVRHAGSPYRKIARQLKMADGTLRNHLSGIYAKLRVSNRAELVLLATNEDFR